MQDIEQRAVHAYTPFGNPDGSRADLEEISKGFVTFGTAPLWGGLSTRPDDLTARVIVGRKGSGKTVYLRRLRAHAATEPSLFADEIQQGLPTTLDIVRFCQWFDEKVLTEQWMLLWHRAILRSLMSHVLWNKGLARHFGAETRETLQKLFPGMVREFRAYVSVYSQVSEIINEHHSSHSIEMYLKNPHWSELETLLAEALSESPPICFYLDAVDEEFAHAPMYWLRCQKGLFYQTMRLLRDAHFGNRLHLIICVRDVVLSSVYKSEHRTRYIGEPHIRILQWTKDSIEYFLSEKLGKLENRYFLEDPGKRGKTVEAWLGTSEMPHRNGEGSEPILQYLLRHTRLLPRDIVVLGNILCNEFTSMKHVRPTLEKQETIRRKVHEAARIFGNEQLAICANEMVSGFMPSDAARHDYSEAYTGSKEYVQGVTEELKKLISFIGADRFTAKKLDESRTAVPVVFEGGMDPFSILWRNGLVGYVDRSDADETYVFYSDNLLDEFNFPYEKELYAFHPIIIDAVGIRAAGKRPVVPFF